MHDVKLVDDPVYTKRVLVNGRVKPTPDGVLLEVLSELTLSDNIVLGHSFIVDVPTYDVHDLEIGLDVTSELDEDDLLSVVSRLFDGGNAFTLESFDGLDIGQELSRERIVGAFEVIEAVVGVTSIVEDDEEISTLDPGVGGVLQLGDVSFSQNVVW